MEISTFKIGEDENMYAAWKNFAEDHIRPPESSRRSSRAKESDMIELNRLSAIEAKLDTLIQLVNKRKFS